MEDVLVESAFSGHLLLLSMGKRVNVPKGPPISGLFNTAKIKGTHASTHALSAPPL